MGRKHKHEEHINLERWLVSYADFVTLLFATFTALYAVSQVDKSKALAFEESIKQSMGASSYDPLRPAGGHFRGFHDYVENSSSSGVGQPAANTFPQSSVLSNAPEYIGKKSQSASMGVMSGHLLKLEENPDLSERIEVSANGDEVIIRLSEAGFFDSAKAEIRKDALPAFQIIGERLESFEGIEILAQGHTDNRPISNLRFRSNRELSTGRANAVVAILEKNHDIDPGYLVAAGYGEYRPLAPNDSPEGMARNRRVDVVVRPMVNDAVRLRKKGEAGGGKSKRGKKRRKKKR